jgi:hypothetical protein
MKKYSYLLLLFIIMSCSKNIDPAGANFKLEFSQSGGYSQYFRFIGLDPVVVYEGTNVAPLTLEGKDLPDDKYTFVTSKPLLMFSPSFIVSTGDSDSSAVFTFKIFRNNVLIDTKIVEVDADEVAPKNYSWDYKATD